MNVFVSRPTSLNKPQTHFCAILMELFESRGLHPRTVGVTDHGNKSPLLKVRNVMHECEGAAILGFSQTLIRDGVAKASTPKQSSLTRVRLPTPWNQLEAGMAFVLNLPMLVIREETVAEDGIFDSGVSDNFVHRAKLSEAWLGSDEFLQPFGEWIDELSSG